MRERIGKKRIKRTRYRKEKECDKEKEYNIELV